MVNDRVTTTGRAEGVTKMRFDPNTHRVLGVGLVGPHGGDPIAEDVLAKDPCWI